MSTRWLVAIGALLCACSSLREAHQDRDATEPAGSDVPTEQKPGDSGSTKRDEISERLEKVDIAKSAPLSGSLSISAGDDGDVVVGWVDTPDGDRTLHIARIAGDEAPPRRTALSETVLEPIVPPQGQAVAVFTPAKGCFGVLYGKLDQLHVAGVGKDAKLGSSSVVAEMEAGVFPIPRLSQARAVPDGAGNVLVAWSEHARTANEEEPHGRYRNASLAFADCSPGEVVVRNDLATALPYVEPPAGVPEIALARTGKVYRAAYQVAKGANVLGVIERSSGGESFSSPTDIDDGKTHGAGGSVGIAPNGDGYVMAYFRRTSDTAGDLVAVTVAKENDSPKETVLEHELPMGYAKATFLEAERATVAGRSGVEDSAVIAAAFRRDASKSEVRVYFADSSAADGFRSELLATSVFGAKDDRDGHALVDVAVDASLRAHVVWRSGSSKGIAYGRVDRP